MATIAQCPQASPKRGGREPKVAAALDAQLDLALAHTFPASDSVAIGHPTSTEAPARPVDRKPPIIEG